MPFFSRQPGRARRVGPEKVRPPSPAGANGRRHVSLVPAMLIGFLTAAVLVFVLTWGRPPIRFFPDDTSDFDITARVAFCYVDEAATHEARDQARLSAPHVYASDNASLDAAKRDFLAAFDRLAQAKDPAGWNAALVDVVKPYDPELALLAADVRRVDGGAARGAFERLFAQINSLGILSEERDLEERRAPSREPIIVNRPMAPSTTVEIRRVLGPRNADELVDQSLTEPLSRVGLRETSRALAEAVKKRLAPTLRFDEAATKRVQEDRAAHVAPLSVSVPAGRVIVPRDKRISPVDYRILQAEQETFDAARSPFARIEELLGLSLLIAVAFILAGLYLRHYRPNILRSVVRMALLGALLVGIVLVARVLFHHPWVSEPLHLVPVAFASMLLALAYDRRFACGATVFLVAITGLVAGTNPPFRPMLALLAGGLVAALLTYDVRKRTSLLKIGFAAGLAHAITALAVGLGQLPAQTVGEGMPFAEQARVLGVPALLGLVNGIAVGVVLTGLLPVLERVFRIQTGISLLELGDLNQPALKSFAMRAPGSYNHSLSVASLAEAAARSVGADDLLARVGSYFHDLGKLNKPHYFVENQTELNPHDRLSPHMSALIIIAHVKDGLEMARELGLPQRILDVIGEHHGTTAVEYFLRRACDEAGEDGPPDDYVFRYAGPKPRSKETAIVMLADSVESASRTLVDPTPAAIENLVRRIAQAKLADGQLEECSMTLAELHAVERSLVRGLVSIFHGRIKY